MAITNEAVQNSEDLFNEIAKSPKEYSTHEIQNWNSLKSDILNILKTHHPVKIDDYEYGLSSTLKKDQRLIVREFEDKSLVREYRRSNNICCGCVSKKPYIDNTVIVKYGIIFVKNEHNCKPRKYSDAIENQEKLKEKLLSQSLQDHENSSDSNILENVKTRISLRQRRDNNGNMGEESVYDEILKSQKEYTESNIDLNMMKEEILELLKTYRPLKIANYQIFSNDSDYHRLVVLNDYDKSMLYEYQKKKHELNAEWKCNKNTIGKDFYGPLIMKFGIAFIPLDYNCKQKRNITNRSAILQNPIFKKKTSKPYNVVKPCLSHNDDNSEHVFNKIINSIEKYTTKSKNTIEEQQIASVLITHRPIKLTHYQYGLSQDLEDNLIIFQNQVKTRIREYLKRGDKWMCRECGKMVSIISGILFAPKYHSTCSIKKSYPYQTLELQEQLRTRKQRERASAIFNVSNILDNDALPVLEGPFFNDDEHFEARLAMNNEMSNNNQNTTISSSTNVSLATDTPCNTTPIPSNLSFYSTFESQNESNNNDFESTIESINDTTALIDSTLQTNLEIHISDRNITGSSIFNTPNPLTLKRKISDNGDDEIRIFIDEKPSLPKKAKVENLPQAQPSLTEVDEEDDCVIIDEKPEIRQISMNNYFDSPFTFEGPSTKMLKDIQHVINEAFRDKLLRTGKMSQQEIDRIFMASTLSDEHLAFITKLLNCRIAIYKESKLCRFGKWESDADILTLVLAYFNGFYSIVLNL